MKRPADNTLIKATAPVDDETVARMVLNDEEKLLRSIMAQPRSIAPETAPPRRLRTPVMRWSLRVAAFGAVCAAVLAGVSLTGRGTVQTSPTTAWAASALRVADAVPRLVLDAPGWQVAHVDEFTPRQGGLTLQKGSQTLVLRWLSAREHRALLAGNATSLPRLPDADVLDRPAALFGVRGVYTAIWRMDRYTFELRTETIGTAASSDQLRRADFETLVGSLRLVGVDAWLAAMPESAVLPSARADTVQELLTDIPLPPGFVAPATNNGAVQDRYQLGADIAGAAACGWIEQWIAARRAGDATAERAAVAALASSHDWPVLHEMIADGGYPEVVWSYADAVAGRGAVPGGRDGLTVEATYREALGCNAG